MEEQGVIVDTKNDKAMVKVARGGACEGCVVKGLCHSVSEAEMVVEAENPINAEKGDRVVIKVGPGVLLRASLILYLIPLLGFIVGVVLGQEVAPYTTPSVNPDLVAGILGLLLMVLTFLGIRSYGRWIEKGKGYRPVIARVV